jgi:hypothetical protein
MLLTGDISTISFFSSRFSTIILLCSVAVLEVMLTSEPKPKPLVKPWLLKPLWLPNGNGVSLKFNQILEFNNRKFWYLPRGLTSLLV